MRLDGNTRLTGNRIERRLAVQSSGRNQRAAPASSAGPAELNLKAQVGIIAISCSCLLSEYDFR